MERLESIKFSIVAGLGAVTAVFGWFGWLILLFLLCVCMDYLTGTLAALKGGEWSSKDARSGIWHKAGMLVVIVISIVFDVLIGLVVNNAIDIAFPFSYEVLVSPIVIVWYILTEVGSIVENAGCLGAPVPDFLRKAVKLLKIKTEETGDKLVGGSEDNEN